MQVLWAPWRMDYILGAKPDSCILCLPASSDISDSSATYCDDKEYLVLYRGVHAFVIMNKFPYNTGHIMVAPIRHSADISALSQKEGCEIFWLLQEGVRILNLVCHPEGINIGLNLGQAAGAGVKDHLHFHIVPRWNGDASFMTAISELRIIPEHITATWEKLRPEFDKLSPCPLL